MKTSKSAHSWLTVVTYIGIFGGLLMPLFFWPVVIFPFVFSKLAFFQVLIGLTFPAYLILAWREKRHRPRPTMLYLAIIAYFTAIILSTIFSVDPVRSFWGNQERMNGLFTLLHFFAWLTMAVGMLKTWPQWRRLLNYQIGLSAFMAVVAILQRPFPDLLSFHASERVGGLLDNPIYMGAYQIFSFFFIALLWLKTNSVKMKVFYAIVGALDLTAFILAQSRGAFVGLMVGIFVFAVTLAIMTPKKNVRKTAIGFLLLGILSYGALYAAKDTDVIKGSFLERYTNFSGTSKTRFIAWDIAWQGFTDRPITGWGMDTFHVIFNEKYNPESLRHGYYETWFDRAHNTVMDVLSMTGMLGFTTFAAVYITLIITVIRAFRKKWIDPIIASILLGLPVGYFVQNLFVFDHPAAFSMSYLLFAFVIAVDSKSFGMTDEKEVMVESESRLPKTAVTAFLIIQAIALVMIWRTTILPVRASMLTIKSNTAFGQGRYEESYWLAKQAALVPTPYIEEQTFLQSRNFMSLVTSGRTGEFPFWKDWYELIIEISDAQVEAHPKNTHPRFIYARFADTMIALVPESRDIAEREYKKAIELSPKRQQLYYSLARFYIREGKFDDAESLLREVITFDEEIGEGHWILGLTLMFDQGKKEEGSAEIVRSRNSVAGYGIRDVREAFALAFAYDVLKDTDGLKSILPIISAIPRGDLPYYVDLARLMERNGLISERNAILGGLSQIDQKMATQFAPVLSGNIASIEEVLATMQNVVVTENPPAKEEVAPVKTEPAQGPRR
ncbi:MAG: O-antigen ligase family protein [bacterium]|nr:O-antigen ligase family protein [bacterium]